MTISYEQLCLSIQRALWGMVTPELRKVYISLDENKIDVYFYYDGELSEKQKDLAECVVTELSADFDDEHNNFEAQIIRLDAPQKIPNQGVLVYSRYEN